MRPTLCVEDDETCNHKDGMPVEQVGSREGESSQEVVVILHSRLQAQLFQQSHMANTGAGSVASKNQTSGSVSFADK